MTPWDVPLADLVIEDEDLEAIVDAYRSGWLTMGARTEQFEQAFAAYTGARHALAVASGTAALHLACMAAGLGPGDEAIVPSLTFVATANAVAYTGATPVFADIAGISEPWLSAASCEQAITPRTRAVLAVAYGGHPGEIEAVRALCDRHGLVLLEDAAHAAGTRLNGRHLGTFGSAGAFSLFSNKNLAVGEGGVVITDDDDLAQTMRLMRSHGMTSLTWDRHRGHAADYDVVALGFNYRLDEPRSALAASRLKRLDDDNRRRGELDRRYRDAIADLPLSVVRAPADGVVSAHHLFTVLVDEGGDRDALRRHMTERRIQTSVHYPPVHRTALYARSPGPELPLTEAHAARTVTLPLYAHMTHAQQDLVVAALGEALTSDG
jgi:dTDP-4-amino-4,6-dideoxygalactose transaminase